MSHCVWPCGSQEGPNLNLGTQNLVCPSSFLKKLAPNSENSHEATTKTSEDECPPVEA